MRSRTARLPEVPVSRDLKSLVSNAAHTPGTCSHQTIPTSHCARLTPAQASAFLMCRAHGSCSMNVDEQAVRAGVSGKTKPQEELEDGETCVASLMKNNMNAKSPPRKGVVP